MVRRVAAILTLAALGLALACTSRRGVEPGPVSYDIYVGATFDWFSYGPGPSKLYIYDADSLTLHDSIPLESMAFDMAISADGRSLYVQMDGPWPSYEGPLSKINARTKEVEWSRSGIGPSVTLLGNGELLLNGHEVLDPLDGSLIRRLPDSVWLGHGPSTGTEVAATVEDATSKYVTVLDIETGRIRGRYVPRLSSGGVAGVYYARLHPDGARVCVIGPRYRLYDSWFVVGDIRTGETLLEHALTYPFGEIALSADGSIAVVTDPSRPLIYDSYPTLDVFDLEAMTHVRRFDFASGIRWPGQVQFLPGDQSVVTAPPAEATGTGPLQVIDLTTLNVTHTIWLPPVDPFPGALCVGPRR